MSVLAIRRLGVKYMTPYEQREFVRRLYRVVGRTGVLHAVRQKGEVEASKEATAIMGGGTATAPEPDYPLSRGD